MVYICHKNTKCELARNHTKLISENFRILLCISGSIWNLFYLQNCTFDLNGYVENHSQDHEKLSFHTYMELVEPAV